MTRKYFGTDGIRGLANKAPMTAEIAMKVGMAAGIAFQRGGHRHRVVIGKDTRLSGYMIENAMVAGFCAAGMDVFLLGPIPTPAGSTSRGSSPRWRAGASTGCGSSSTAGTAPPP